MFTDIRKDANRERIYENTGLNEWLSYYIDKSMSMGEKETFFPFEPGGK